MIGKSTKISIIIGVVVVSFILSILVSTQLFTTEEGSKSQSDTAIESIVQGVEGILDGVYQETVQYSSPGGSDEITVTVTVQNELISSVDIDFEASNSTSRRYITGFISEIEDEVVSKPIRVASTLDAVAGASLTTDAFIKALNAIR